MRRQVWVVEEQKDDGTFVPDIRVAKAFLATPLVTADLERKKEQHGKT